ncbi:hypothetical protein B0A52_03960 [Exophiala mesophila]|uniref:Uncharacterized protein n=1 Tax=Exophiala mesophila TaxID=212818 RepID=A0A438N7Z2_EXOME|nr:hypothetical protein B0A52_03960 [Exophiala mesophila]
MLSSFIKRSSPQTVKATGPQCSESAKQRKIVFCDWGFHGRASKDGWCFTYVDEVDFDPDEDLRFYNRTSLDKCGEVLAKFVKSQLRKNSNLKESKGWKFVCLIEDGQKHTLPIQRRDRTPRTMLLFERVTPCPCAGRQHPYHESKESKYTMQQNEEISTSPPDVYEIHTPPPQYRSRVSTLATLQEDEQS